MLSLPFQLRDGRSYQLTKHPRLAHASADAQAAAPWGIRMVSPATGKRGWQSLRTSDDKDALRRAKDLLEAAASGAEAWTTHAEINHRRAGLLVGTLITEYLDAGCPRIQDRALTPRTGRSLATSAATSTPLARGGAIMPSRPSAPRRTPTPPPPAPRAAELN
jgi:hypothetical protein